MQLLVFGRIFKVFRFWSCDYRYGQRRCPHLFWGAHQGSGERGRGGETEDSSEREKAAAQKQRRFPGECKQTKGVTKKEKRPACFSICFLSVVHDRNFWMSSMIMASFIPCRPGWKCTRVWAQTSALPTCWDSRVRRDASVLTNNLADTSLIPDFIADSIQKQVINESEVYVITQKTLLQSPASVQVFFFFLLCQVLLPWICSSFTWKTWRHATTMKRGSLKIFSK